jgi:hypothetical protein
VQLRPSWYGGVTALVLIPSSLLLAEREVARSMAGGAPPSPPAQLVPEGAGRSFAELPTPGGRPANVHDLFDDYRTGMVHGRVTARSRRAGRPSAEPPADGGPPSAS